MLRRSLSPHWTKRPRKGGSHTWKRHAWDIPSFCGAVRSFWAATKGRRGCSMRLLPGSGAPWTCQRPASSPARSSARTSYCSRSAKAAWAPSGWPSRPAGAALVALKLIKAGMDSRQVIARFEAERQALALMDHPNIARVLDAGATESGRPYFVMDLVKGVPITRYCDEHHLTPRQRLELFMPVCQAVQHAHQKGIIHRDIKPSNVWSPSTTASRCRR